MSLTVTDLRVHPGDSAYLIDDGNTSVLYDSGFAFTGYALAENVKKALGKRNLDYIFLTHSHYDHALGSVYVLESYPETKVVAGEYAANIFQKESARRVMRELDRKFADLCGAGDYPDRIDKLKVDIPVKDGDVIQAGDLSFTVLSLPGHTRCSVAYYLKEERLLLGCETLGVFDGEQTIVPSYLVGVDMTLQSIRRVEQMEIDRILFPHLGLFDKEKTAFFLQNARKSAEDTRDAIAAMLKSGKTTEEAVEYFKNRFYHSAIRSIYPPDAMLMNTKITVELIRKEFCSEQ